MQLPEHEHRAATVCCIRILIEEIYRKPSQTSAGLLPAHRRYVFGGSIGKTHSTAVRRQNASCPYGSSVPEGKELEEPPAAPRSPTAALRAPRATAAPLPAYPPPAAHGDAPRTFPNALLPPKAQLRTAVPAPRAAPTSGTAFRGGSRSRAGRERQAAPSAAQRPPRPAATAASGAQLT